MDGPRTKRNVKLTSSNGATEPLDFVENNEQHQPGASTWGFLMQVEVFDQVLSPLDPMWVSHNFDPSRSIRWKSEDEKREPQATASAPRIQHPHIRSGHFSAPHPNTDGALAYGPETPKLSA